MKSSKMTEVSFVAIDLETTGLDPDHDRIVELAAVRFNMNATLHQTFHALVNPKRSIPTEMTRIHGITNQMVTNSADATEILPKFIEFIAGMGTTLVAHNARFDLAFLEACTRRAGRNIFATVAVDTIALARKRLPNLERYSLSCVSDVLRLSKESSHRALPDAILTMEVFVRLVRMPPSLTSLTELFGVTRQLKISVPRTFATK